MDCNGLGGTEHDFLVKVFKVLRVLNVLKVVKVI